MSLHLKLMNLEAIRQIEMDVGRSISIINDILSFEKQVKTSTAAHEGSTLRSAVSILCLECKVSYDAAKHVLWTLCREYEPMYKVLVESLAEKIGPCNTTLKLCIRGLEYQMSGNELWSRTAERYQDVE